MEEKRIEEKQRGMIYSYRTTLVTCITIEEGREKVGEGRGGVETRDKTNTNAAIKISRFCRSHTPQSFLQDPCKHQD